MSPAPVHGYSGKPLADKLGVKPGAACVAVNAPPQYPALMAGADIAQAAPNALGDGPFDLVHWFAVTKADLAEAITVALPRLAERGALWISWPKKTSALHADLTEDGVRELALPVGLVDVKVCAVDQDWSALKLVRRKT